MEDGVSGVSGVNARFHVEVGNIPENVSVTALNQKMKASNVLAILPKQDHVVTKTSVQVSKIYPKFIVDARRF